MLICRFVHFTVVLLIFGMCVFQPILSTPRLRSRTLPRALLPCAWIALASGMVWWVLTTADMAGIAKLDSLPNALWRVSTLTFFGHVWCLHLLLSAALVVALAVKRVNPKVVLGLSGAALVTLAPVGHGAMFDGWHGQLMIANQALHLLCIGAWLGGLLMLLKVLRGQDSASMVLPLKRFSGIGYGLVAVIVATGVVNVRALSGAFWPEPAFSGFGLILAIKLGAVAVMLGLALANRCMLAFGIRPTLLRASITLEWLCGLGAIAAVSLLGTLPPM